MAYRLKLYSVKKSDFVAQSNSFDGIKYDQLDFELELGDFLNFSVIEKKEYSIGHVYNIAEHNLLDIIQQYHAETKKYFVELQNELNNQNYRRIKTYFQFKVICMDDIDDLLNLDKTNKKLSKNVKYEYDIFELVRLYKTVNFDDFNLICIGN